MDGLFTYDRKVQKVDGAQVRATNLAVDHCRTTYLRHRDLALCLPPSRDDHVRRAVVIRTE